MKKGRKTRGTPPRTMPGSRKRKAASRTAPDLRGGFAPVRCYGIALGEHLVLVDATPADETSYAVSCDTVKTLMAEYQQPFRVAECLVLEVR